MEHLQHMYVFNLLTISLEETLVSPVCVSIYGESDEAPVLVPPIPFRPPLDILEVIFSRVNQFDIVKQFEDRQLHIVFANDAFTKVGNIWVRDSKESLCNIRIDRGVFI